ncbi:MAG: hypothetical protein R2795_26625 [Saprospiraceae bacterium]
MIRTILLGLTVLLTSLSTTAQTSTDSLPTDVLTQFMEDMAGMMTVNKPKETETAFRDFEGAFYGGTFTEDEKKAILNTGLRMQSRRVNAAQFEDYFNALMAAKQSTTAANSVLEWNQVVQQLLDDEERYRANAVIDLLEFSSDYFQKQAIRFSPSSVSWYAFPEKTTWAYTDQPECRATNALLTAIRSDDSLSIERTNFTYKPLEKKLYGQGGNTNWARTELGAAVAVELGSYSLETIRSLYESEEAYLTYPQYFGAKKIKGNFSDKLVSDDSRTSYPRFESTEGVINIPNIGDGVRLRGGFRLHGATTYAVGSRENPAELVVLNELNQPRFQGVGQLVTVKEQDRIMGEDVLSIIYLGADSLYHPSANLRLNLKDMSLELSRGKDGTFASVSFYHSLHQMNIDADFIKAYLRE